MLDSITPTTLYIGTFWGELYKSTDGGKNWRAFTAGLNNNHILVLAVDPLTPSILYIGTGGGGIFTNQVFMAFTPLPMPSLTAAPFAPTADISLSPTKTLFERPTLVPLKIPFKVSGPLNFRKHIQLPENARVLVVWSVTAGYPDYSYVFGEGTIDINNNSFEIEFDKLPPPESLNWYDSGVLGVGTVIITTNQALKTGSMLPESFSESDILGASGQYSIIYVNGNFETLGGLNWCNQFNQGYSAGKGIVIPNSAFDGFEPINQTTIEIIMDDLENILFVNWT